MATELDVTQVDGPHSAEKTAAAARLIADAVRFLNYASLPASRAPGISYAGDVDDVVGAIAGAVNGLQQTLDQLTYCLQRDLAGGHLQLDDYGRRYAHSPAYAVEAAGVELETAKNLCGQLRDALNRARRFTGSMYLEDDLDREATNGR